MEAEQQRGMLTRGGALALAWPMVFANAAVPLAGVVDTAVIGAVGDKGDLGGVSLGATLFSLLLFSFYFLRMGSTGLTSQAQGAGDAAEVQRVLIRAVGLGLVLGLGVWLLRGPIGAVGFAILQGGPVVEALGADYLRARTFGAPGAYAVFAVTGWFIGIGRTRPVLVIHVAFGATNIVLDLVFVLGLGLGVAGLGYATAIGDTVAAGMGLAWAAREVRRMGGWRPGVWSGALDLGALRRLIAVNRDLMIRSWGLLLGFTWFTNTTARHGAAVLAGSHVLMQIVTVTAFVLDAFAFTAENAVGEAMGARSLPRLRRAIRVTTELSLASGVLFSLAILLLGAPLLGVWIADPEALAQARRFLPWCAAIPTLGAVAWQLDGIFAGATRTAALRNASAVSAGLYVGLDLVLTPLAGPAGTWTAFVLYYLARAGTLGAGYPALERAVAGQAADESSA